MLAPTTRKSLYDIVRAPAGWTFDALVACTYSADLRSILALPAAVAADGRSGSMSTQTVTPAQLALLRRTCERSIVFVQEAALLGADDLTSAVIETEGMVKAVNAPNGGAFHPKVWMVRFRSGDRLAYRLAVMSRNLTADRSWDAGLVLESQRTAGPPTANGLKTLLEALPALCRAPLDDRQSELLDDFAAAAASLRWAAPPGLGRLDLKVTGLGQTWAPPPNEKLVVFSPFLDRGAIRLLGNGTDRAAAVVSRPDALDRCWPAAADVFDRRMVLDVPPELSDSTPSGALHAKMFAWDRRGRTGLAIGSMNATQAALGGRNVEFMAIADATKLLPNGAAALVETGSLARLVADYAPGEGGTTEDLPPDDRPVRRAICDLDLKLVCEPVDENWRISLVARRPLTTADSAGALGGLVFRPATLPANQAAPCLDALTRDGAASFPGLLPLAKVTGYVVFEGGSVAAFTLNLPVEGVTDEARRTAALRTILPDEHSFLDFVRAYLGDDLALDLAAGAGTGFDGENWRPRAGGSGLLETLVRCAADTPDRLHRLDDAIQSLGATEYERLAPQSFRVAWAALVGSGETHA